VKPITLFDTSIATKNVGDLIIMEAVKEQITGIIPSKQIITIPSHLPITRKGWGLLKSSEFSLVGGTNLLSSHLLKYRQWKFNLSDLFCLKKTVLMGVGWWQYQDKPDLYSKMVWKRVLHKEMLHSVRDSFTEKHLKSMGFDNVTNTGCPTMWGLTPEHCSQIRPEKGDSVIFTLTDYNQNPGADIKLVNTLLDNYPTVSFWPQGTGDMNYFNSLASKFKRDVKVLNPNLTCLNEELLLSGVDYVGTRLHAGVRALQLKVRTIIIGIDNRALEKSRDFNLNVIDRKNIDDLDVLINKDIITAIELPIDNIKRWKAQFL